MSFVVENFRFKIEQSLSANFWSVFVLNLDLVCNTTEKKVLQNYLLHRLSARNYSDEWYCIEGIDTQNILAGVVQKLIFKYEGENYSLLNIVSSLGIKNICIPLNDLVCHHHGLNGVSECVVFINVEDLQGSTNFDLYYRNKFFICEG